MTDEVRYKPSRSIADPYPVSYGMAIDSFTRKLVLSDPNRKSILVFSMDDAKPNGPIVEPSRQIIGPETEVGFVAGIALDVERGEIFAVNNDIEDRLVVFDYEDDGNVRPKRRVMVPHSAWGISIGSSELAVSVQELGVVVYNRARLEGLQSSCPQPDRAIYGINSEMADPRGIFLDEKNNEIVVACHGNWNPEGIMIWHQELVHHEMKYGGKFLPPSINFYDRYANGDVLPKRKIAGPSTQLNWPMGIHVDLGRDEVFVANNGDDSVLVFDRRSNGDVHPKRVIRGKKTGIRRPVAVQVDPEEGELWVANFGDRSVLVFDEDDEGDVPPRRIIRFAPVDAPVLGLGNPMAATYDSKRGQLILANCVTQTRLYALDPKRAGLAAPVRVIEGQRSRLSRRIHGIAYNPVKDELIVPNPLAAAIMTFRGDADGEERPIRTIQGPRTKLAVPHTVNLAVKRQEILVGDLGRKGVLVFGVEDSGDVAPRRIISGKKTRLDFVFGVAMDEESGTIVVANTARWREDAITGLLFFDKDANGDVEPIGYIAGPNTMIREGKKGTVWWLQIYRGKVIVSIPNHIYRPCFRLASCDPEVKSIPPSPWLTSDGLVAIWDVNDRGDVPPRYLIKGPFSELCVPNAFAVNPASSELYVVDSFKNEVFAFKLPEIFKE